MSVLKLLGIASLGAFLSGAVITARILDASGKPPSVVGKIAAVDPGSRTETASPPVAAKSHDAPPIPVEMRPSVAAPPDSGADAFRVGDKLRIDFYQRLELDEEKWGRPRSPRPSFQQRTEFSGDYVINDDGTLSLPLIGSFAAAKHTGHDLENVLEHTAEERLGGKGFVTISVIEHQPVYVLGPVKNPGSFKYASGMTVLHAVALAGGLDRANLEPWQRVESVRENGKEQDALSRTTQLMALAAVLKSEHDNSPIEVPPRLTEIVGAEQAGRLIEEQKEHRQTAVWLRRNRESAAKTAFDNAKNEVAILSDGTKPLDDIIKLRSERVDNVKSLIRNNVLANSMLVQAQSDLSDVQERKQTTLSAVALAKQRLATAEQDMARQHAQSLAEIEQEITTTDKAIADGERELQASKGVLKVLSKGAGARRDTMLTESDVAYEIVRRGPQGATVIAAAGTSLLEPGDLVRVRQKSEPELSSEEKH
jgi:polysaccharide biosynthesis/export protein ExoF